MVLAHNIDDGSRTQDIQISQNISFETMLLDQKTLTGLKKSGFTTPSPVQLHGVPLGKCGFDLVLEAKSGTGKTVVFTVIALEKIDVNNRLQTMILAPTREIAYQIHDVMKQIGAYYEGLNIQVVMGGLPVNDDIIKFEKKVHVVVGSPGRLRHLIQGKHIDVSSIRLLVLDEADKLVEKSFISDINYIISKLPKAKQVILSSATYPEETKSFIMKYVKNAQYICPESNSILIGIQQKIITVPFNSNIVTLTNNRYKELKNVLSQKTFKQCLIFCNYQARVSELYTMLRKDKWPVKQLYGQQDQSERLEVLKTLQEYKCRILVSTDLAARGIDASNVDAVINFEPPFEWQTYLHRIGRSGRYGSYGTAITFLSKGKEEETFKEQLTKINVPIDLRYFWTDEPFSLFTEELKLMNDRKIEKDIVINPKPNNILQEQWNIINSSTENLHREDILSINNLCDSFKNTKTTIETFADLIVSFQKNENIINQKDTYKIITIPKLPISYILTNEHDKYSNATYNSTINNSIHVASCEANNNIENMINKECSQNNIFSKHDEEKVSLDHDLSAISAKCLLDAGLPTAFTSSKYKSKNHMKVNAKQKSQSSKSNLINSSDENQKIVPTNEMYDPSLDIAKHTKKFSEKNKEVINKPVSVSNYSVLGKQIPDNLYEYCTTSSSQLQKRNKQFNNWYNQLKAQMRYIEYITYLEELRKC